MLLWCKRVGHQRRHRYSERGKEGASLRHGMSPQWRFLQVIVRPRLFLVHFFVGALSRRCQNLFCLHFKMVCSSCCYLLVTPIGISCTIQGHSSLYEIMVWQRDVFQKHWLGLYSNWYWIAKGRQIHLLVTLLLLHGLTNQAETFWVGCGRSAECLAKISADSVKRKKVDNF